MAGGGAAAAFVAGAAAGESEPTARAPATGAAARAKPSEAAWREAWVGAPFEGTVDIAPDAATGEEHLVVRSREVLAKYGMDACVVDDGRTVGIGLEDSVAFGVVPRPGKAPMAVNVYRLPRKRRRVGVDAGLSAAPAGLPAGLAGDLRGVIRSQQARTGDLFIDCEEVYRHYQRNAKIFFNEMPDGVAIGDPIIFSVLAPFTDTSAPRARNVVRATGEVAEAILAKASKGKGRGGKGKGGWRGASWAVPRRADLATVMRMVGVVKKKSHTGRHFILCQDISDVYGRDAQIPAEEEPEGGLRVGDRIAFDVDEPRDGQQGIPLARHVRVVDRVGGKRKAAPAGGDGEDQDEDEPIDPGDGEDLVDADGLVEEPVFDEKDVEEAEAQDRLETGGGGRAPPAAAAAGKTPAAAAAAAAAAPAAQRAAPGGVSPMASPMASPGDPTTPEEWQERQGEMFPGMPPLVAPWIRIRSKSKGLVYFYNMETGASSAKEPRLA